jgi:hypothetical protein
MLMWKRLFGIKQRVVNEAPLQHEKIYNLPLLTDDNFHEFLPSEFEVQDFARLLLDTANQVVQACEDPYRIDRHMDVYIQLGATVTAMGETRGCNILGPQSLVAAILSGTEGEEFVRSEALVEVLGRELAAAPDDNARVQVMAKSFGGPAT